MRRYLVLAHQTLDSPALLDAIQERMARGPSTFHLVVPERHGRDGNFTWNEGEVRLRAARKLDEARLRLTRLGVPVTGEVGHTNPVQSANNALMRHPPDHYDEILVSTLPARVSRWLGMDVPARIASGTKVPVTTVTESRAAVA